MKGDAWRDDPWTAPVDAVPDVSDSEPWTRGHLIFLRVILGTLLLVGFLLLVVAALDPTSSARALDAGDVDRVSGTLDQCGGRLDFWSGKKFCLETEQHLDEASMPVEWPTFRKLDPLRSDSVIGVIHDGWLVAIQTPDGDVIRSADVGWRGSLFWATFGFALIWSAFYLGYGIKLDAAWKTSLLGQFKWWWGLAALAVIDLHGRLLPAALIGDVVILTVVATRVARWRRLRGTARNHDEPAQPKRSPSARSARTGEGLRADRGPG